MNEAMKKRLVEYAHELIEARKGEMRLRGGYGVQVDGRVVNSLDQPQIVTQPVEPETWELVLWYDVIWDDSLLGPGQLLKQGILVPRVSGLPTPPSFGSQAELIEAPALPRTRTVELILYTRAHPEWPFTFNQIGVFDPGPVIVTIEEFNMAGGAVVNTY
jgi:hypothetical protein